ncbi:hypothetical protein K438DRAFT_1959972 [Mycena galopus ATCC 62051]|nr:hypothetical protein K438DRAFT_1959972 [Mycena galopus ATCC 62051]
MPPTSSHNSIQMPPFFRKERVRVVSLHKVSRVSVQALEHQLSLSHAAFAELPIMKNNILKYEVTIANDVKSLGVERYNVTAIVVLEAEVDLSLLCGNIFSYKPPESYAKIEELLKDPAFQKRFEAEKEHAVFGRCSTMAFTGDVMTVIDK